MREETGEQGTGNREQGTGDSRNEVQVTSPVLLFPIPCSLSPLSVPCSLFPVLLTLLACHCCLAAPDDEEITAEAAAAAHNINRAMFGEQNFDQWVFQGVGNAEAGRLRLQTQANLKLAEVNRVCQLTPVQKQKLQLAARGDLQRFNDQVEEARRKFDAVKHDQNAMGNVWQDIQPLQRKQAQGLMDSDSLTTKILARTLSAEQNKAYNAVEAERARFRYRASIASSLITLEGSVALNHAEREALTKLLLEETPAPRATGQYDYYLMLYRLGGMPEAKVRPLIDDRRWAALKQQFTQYRGMRATLIQQGMLTEEEAGAGPDLSVPAAILRRAP